MLISAADVVPYSDTFWGTMLSGLVGAVVGGGITAAAVFFTIRHERMLASDERAAVEAGALMQLTTDLLTRLDEMNEDDAPDWARRATESDLIRFQTRVHTYALACRYDRPLWSEMLTGANGKIRADRDAALAEPESDDRVRLGLSLVLLQVLLAAKGDTSERDLKKELRGRPVMAYLEEEFIEGLLDSESDEEEEASADR